MARFSVGGDEEGNEERPNCNHRKPRTSNTAASTSDSGDRTAAPPMAQSEFELRPDEPVTVALQSDLEGVVDDEEDDEDQQSEDAVEAMEARVNSTPDGSDDTNLNGLISLTLTDPDVLDCPFCFEPLSSPVYQCENGHISCASCCTTTMNKCPTCCMPIGYNRCRAIEKVLKSVRIACRNRQYGCMETLNYSEKRVHENTCINAPCYCPHPGCDYMGTSNWLYAHFSTLHSNSRKQFDFGTNFFISLDNTHKHVFLQEKNQSILFVINHRMEAWGSFVNVVCVAPTSGKRRFLYYVWARNGESSVRLKSCAECIMKWTPDRPKKMYLMVPNNFICGVSGQLNLDVIIWGDR